MNRNEQPIWVFGIIPAAGLSRRMGTPKQLLPIDGRPMLQVVLDHLCAAALEGVVVVTRSEILAAWKPEPQPRVQFAINDNDDSQMIDSVLLGIERLRARYEMKEEDGLLVCPGDNPRIGRPVVEACVTAYRRHVGGIIRAVHRGRRGHPIIIPCGRADELPRLAQSGGLDQLPRQHPALVTEVACDEPGVAQDVDTPTDYTNQLRDTGDDTE